MAGLGWGLPQRWHPDEKADALTRMMEAGTALPESYINPTLPRYAAWPLVALHARLPLPGRLGDPLLPMRVLSAAVSAAAVLLLAWHAGWIAGLVLALMPVVVNLAHFATPEPFLLLGAAATVLLAARHAEGRAPAWTVGLALGFSASSKYTAVALALPALLATVWRPREVRRLDRGLVAGAGVVVLAIGVLLLLRGEALAAQLHLPDARLLQPEHAQGFVRGLSRAALLAGAGALVVAATGRFARVETVVLAAVAAAAFMLGTPGALLEPLRFLSDLAFNHQTRYEYKGLAAQGSAWGEYAWLLLAGTGFTPFLAALFAGRRGPRLVLPALAVAATYTMLASAGHVALRFLVPAFPAIAWLAGQALERRPRLAPAVLALPALLSLLIVRLFFVDARERAGTWLARNTPPGATIDYVVNDLGYAPPAPPGRTARQVRALSREMAPPEVFSAAAEAYPRDGAPWLVLSAAYHQRFLDHPEQRPERTAFFRGLLGGAGGYEVAARFRQPWWLRPENEFLDPEIVVLRKAQFPTK